MNSIIFGFLLAMVIPLAAKQEYQLGPWLIVNDTVMGGLSQSNVESKEGSLVFSGALSLDNNGGFASTRAAFEPRFSERITKVLIEVEGDGREYQLRFRTNRRLDGPAYAVKFSTEKDQLMRFEYSSKDFQATYRGYAISDPRRLSFDEIRQMGFLIADKNEEPFRLVVKSVTFKN
ncbi:CIA30 family protein [Pleionea sediminis]|uniref:CIA30 family protein n=1 Tax=Pleionea sediminis TaxID=2569479 RepID=UPI001185D7FB|nr:CIA30 family protein [Pleionea sediminis]